MINQSVNKKSVKILSSQIKDGNMSFSLGGKSVVLENRIKFFEANNLDMGNLCILDQCHSDTVVKINNSDLGTGSRESGTIKADAMYSNNSNAVLGVLTADCMPVIVYSSDSSFIAIAHVGYIGVENKITIKLIKRIINEYKIELDSLRVYIGPHVKGSSYLKKALASNFKSKAWEPFIKTIDNKYSIDITSRLIFDLSILQLNRDLIKISNIDTYTNSNYFSYSNKSKQNSRFLTIVSLA